MSCSVADRLPRRVCRLLIAVACLVASAGRSGLAQQPAVAVPPAPGAAEQAAPAPATAAAPNPDEGFRFHGYLRSGFGVTGDGKPMEPFIAPNAGAKYRLGNEAEAYLETTFNYGQTPEGDPGAFFDTKITVSYTVPTSSSNDFDTTVSLREAWALARGVWKAQPEATFWAGERFYDRHDLHMSDFYYRDMSGFGGGIEGVALGGRARLAAAWLGGAVDQVNPDGSVPAESQYRFDKNTLDVRLYAVPAGRARLAFAFDLSHFNGDVVPDPAGDIVFEDGVGVAGSVIVERPFAWGRNITSVQVGTGPASNFRAVLTTPEGRSFQPGETVDTGDLWRVRLVNDLIVEPRPRWSLLLGTVYQELDNGAAAGSRIRWISLGARPGYHFSPYFSLEAEAGWDYTDQAEGPAGSLVKLTVAPQITPQLKALSRPALRAYATWARWSEDFVGLVAPIDHGGERHGFTVGVQLETWW